MLLFEFYYKIGVVEIRIFLKLALMVKNMDNNGRISAIVDNVLRIIPAELIVLYGSKRDVVSGSIKDIDICIVAETDDKTELENRLYLSVESEISFDLKVYTPDEWEQLITDRQSFAHRILEKGKVIYEREKE